MIATAFAATVPAASAFRPGRDLAAWLGLVPRQHATGGKPRQRGRSKRGDAYLRRQLIHGARALVEVSPGRTGKLWAWVNRLRARRPFNVVVAAVAHKPARMIWAMLSRGEAYRAAADHAPATATSCAGDVEVMADRSDRSPGTQDRPPRSVRSGEGATRGGPRASSSSA